MQLEEAGTRRGRPEAERDEEMLAVPLPQRLLIAASEAVAAADIDDDVDDPEELMQQRKGPPDSPDPRQLRQLQVQIEACLGGHARRSGLGGGGFGDDSFGDVGGFGAFGSRSQEQLRELPLEIALALQGEFDTRVGATGPADPRELIQLGKQLVAEAETARERAQQRFLERKSTAARRSSRRSSGRFRGSATPLFTNLELPLEVLSLDPSHGGSVGGTDPFGPGSPRKDVRGSMVRGFQFLEVVDAQHPGRGSLAEKDTQRRQRNGKDRFSQVCSRSTLYTLLHPSAPLYTLVASPSHAPTSLRSDAGRSERQGDRGSHGAYLVVRGVVGPPHASREARWTLTTALSGAAPSRLSQAGL